MAHGLVHPQWKGINHGHNPASGATHGSSISPKRIPKGVPPLIGWDSLSNDQVPANSPVDGPAGSHSPYDPPGVIAMPTPVAWGNPTTPSSTWAGPTPPRTCYVGGLSPPRAPLGGPTFLGYGYGGSLPPAGAGGYPTPTGTAYDGGHSAPGMGWHNRTPHEGCNPKGTISMDTDNILFQYMALDHVSLNCILLLCKC